ncbi:hypothetical protein ACFXTO_007428 [Malus domestica]
MGYVSSQKGYKVYNPNTKKLAVSRDVRFDEYSPYSHKGLETNANMEDLMNLFPLPILAKIHEVTPAHISTDNSQLTESVTDAVPSSSEPLEAQANQQAISAPRRNPTRDRHPPVRLQEYVTYTARRPISAAISYHRFSSSHTFFLNKVSHTFEPRNFHEATCMPEWQDAMTKELQALNDNQTWSVVDLPNGKTVVGSKWIYKTKFNSNGSIEKYKAWLVAQGFTQTYGIDYKETFAPVAKMNTVRVLFYVAVNNAWPLFQIDVKNAFLHGDLEEEMYMKLPPGHPRENEPNKVCRLHKAIYGLKQSPRAWYSKLSSVLKAAGFKRSYTDSFFFVRSSIAGKLVVLIYVDNLIITGDNISEIKTLKQSLHQKISIKDLGPLKYFLGI